MRSSPLSGTAAAALVALALLPGSSTAQVLPQPIGPWDGSNPFNCELQDVGTGTDFPDPEADPFCVKFDKTAQNVTDFGLVDFLVQEPARVAAALPKCFYYQHDHWTGSIVQGQDPELWNWVGSYFFDRARGVGGLHVTDFRLGGVPMDATPYAPPEYHPYLEETGGGGAQVLLAGDPDPSCAARVATPEGREEVYAGEPRAKRCITPGGKLRGRRVGKARLGSSVDAAHRKLGPPRRKDRGVHRWCLTAASTLRVAFAAGERADGTPLPRGAALIRTTNRAHSIRRIGPGSPKRAAIRKLGLRRAFFVKPATVFAAFSASDSMLLAGIRRKRVRWLAIADPRRLAERARLRATLGRMRTEAGRRAQRGSPARTSPAS